MTKRIKKPLTEEQRVKAREAHRNWMEQNPETLRESRRRANEKYREKRKEWIARNRAAIREYDKAWYSSNRERIIAVKQAWREQNKARLAEYWRQYRLRKSPNSPKRKGASPDPNEARLRALNTDALFAAASKAVPSTIKAWRREDIISEIVIAVLEGHIEVSQIQARAKEFIGSYNRRFSEYMNAEFNDAFHGATFDPEYDEEESKP